MTVPAVNHGSQSHHGSQQQCSLIAARGTTDPNGILTPVKAHDFWFLRHVLVEEVRSRYKCDGAMSLVVCVICGSLKLRHSYCSRVKGTDAIHIFTYELYKFLVE